MSITRFQLRLSWLCLSSTVAFGAACAHDAGTGDGAGGSAVGGTAGTIVITPPPPALPVESPCTTGSSGPRLLRRLSASEFAASVRDLFGDQTAPVATVFNDAPALGFRVDSNGLLVRDLTGQQLMDNAELVAHWAVTTHLADLSTCTTMDTTCRQRFINTFGKRAFRAPVSNARVADYDQLFAAEASFSDGVEAVVSAVLQSPYFLYRGELGTITTSTPGTGDVALTPYEIASSLSYLLVGSMPDDQLMAAADASTLSTPQQIDQQVQRLLSDPRSANALFRFATGWLELDRLNSTVKDDTVFMLTDALRQDMASETRNLVLDTFNTNGGLGDLLTADHSFLNSSLAQFYGLPTGGLGAAFTKVPYPASGSRDRGILAHASVLVGHATAAASSPTQRGHMVRTRLLCLNVPPMPTNLDTALKPPQQVETTRQHYEQHGAVEPCRTCHQMMDPIGFGLEHYDAFGRYRDQDSGFPVDATGTLFGLPGGDVSFTGLGQLASVVAGRDEAKTCLVRYWAYAAYGSASWDQDACTYAGIRQEATANAFSMRSVLLAIIHAPHFTRRSPDK